MGPANPPRSTHELLHPVAGAGGDRQRVRVVRTGPGKPDELETKARAMIAAMAKEDFKAAVKDFSADLLKVFPADKLEATWKTLNKQVGAFKKQTGVRREKTDKYQVVVVTCEFENAALDIQVSFDDDKKINGLRPAPAKLPE